MGVSQSSSQQIQSENRKQRSQPDPNRIPELVINVETWTRESHGLYDFEGTEIQKLGLKLKGSHRIVRDDSRVSAERVLEDQTFEESEKQLSADDKEKVIARCLYRDNTYWLYHKNLIDETAEAVLERKPEEKIWQVVKQIQQAEFDFPCYKMKRNDLIKVGRVRFKIRELMSPIYREINEAEDLQQAQFRRVYPSYDPSSIQDSLNVTDQSQNLDEPFQNQLLPQQEDTDSEVEFGDEIDINDHQQNDVQLQQNNSNAPSLMNGTGTALFLQREITKAPSKKLKKEKALLLQKLEQAMDKSEAPVCRICLCEEDAANDPLISPCKCAGSMRFIHISCLKTWFANKRVVKMQTLVSTYFWKNLECELCKSPYPYETRTMDGRDMLNIIEYEIPERSANYIVLESISSNTSKVIHVVNMHNTCKLFIGRGHEAHVRVTDISVSRLHAVIIKSTLGYYYLSDNDSKFGTLALVRSPLMMKPNMKTQLQIGRSLLTVEIKPNIQNLLLLCLCIQQKQSQPKENMADDEQHISLDGINYFPKEFVNQAYIKLMTTRQQKQMRSLRRKNRIQKPIKNHQTTQQNNESGALEEQVDQFIASQNELMSQGIFSVDERNGLQQQNNQDSSEFDREEDQDVNGFLSQQNEILIQPQQRSPRSRQISQNDESESYESVSDDEDEEERQAQAQDLQMLEQAIQESLALHNLQQQQQQQLNDSRTVQQSLIEEQKIEQENSRIIVEPNEESKVHQPINDSSNQIESNEFLGGKRQHLSQIHPEELLSNISTSRQSQYPHDLKSSVIVQRQKPLLDNDYEDYSGGDRTILHDMPTQLVPKAKANFLGNQDKLKTQRQESGTNSKDLMSRQMMPSNHVVGIEGKNQKNATKTNRSNGGIDMQDIASQVIQEQEREELTEENGRVDFQDNGQIPNSNTELPQCATDVQPPPNHLS